MLIEIFEYGEHCVRVAPVHCIEVMRDRIGVNHSIAIPINGAEPYPVSLDQGILINGHLTVQAAADATGYNIQYLRRLLRSGTLEGIKIGQIWLIEMQSLEMYLQHTESTSDRRCGPR